MTLEAERFNVDYLKFRQSGIDRTVEVEARAKMLSQDAIERAVEARMAREREQHKAQLISLTKAYFDAGRFAAGARDVAAYRGNKAMLKLEKEI